MHVYSDQICACFICSYLFANIFLILLVCSSHTRVKLTPKNMRDLALLSHLMQGFPANVTLMSAVPYVIPWQRFAIHVCHCYVPQRLLMDSLNASVVALCKADLSEVEYTFCLYWLNSDQCLLFFVNWILFLFLFFVVVFFCICGKKVSLPFLQCERWLWLTVCDCVYMCVCVCVCVCVCCSARHNFNLLHWPNCTVICAGCASSCSNTQEGFAHTGLHMRFVAGHQNYGGPPSYFWWHTHLWMPWLW